MQMKKRKKKRKGRECSWVWWRNKFVVGRRETIARGRDVGESPEQTRP